MNDTFVVLLGIVVSLIVVWLVISSLVSIHRHFGLTSTRGLLWSFGVVVCSLFGVILHRYFRKPTEELVGHLIEKR